MNIDDQAYKLIANTQFYNELVSTRLADVSMLVLSYFLSFEPYINGVLSTKRYIVFQIVFMYVYVLVSSYEICFIHFGNIRQFKSGYKLLNVVFPTPPQIRLLGLTALLRYMSFLLAIGLVACFIIRYLIGGSIAIYLSLIIALPFVASAGGLFGWRLTTQN